MENNGVKICRICLKKSKNMEPLFILKFTRNNSLAVDFIRKITDLKIVEMDTLPNKICSQCVADVERAFDFAQKCVASDTFLKNEDSEKMLAPVKKEFGIEENTFIKCEDWIKSEKSDDQNDQCAISDEIDESKAALEAMQYAMYKNKNKYNCEVCALTFSNKIKFKVHTKMHDESKSFKCKECSQIFSKRLHLNAHLRCHIKEEDKQFLCEMCGEQFVFEFLLRKHEYKHKGEKPFPCTKCDKGCLTAETFRRHMKTHDTSYTKKTHSCQVCQKGFPYPCLLVDHMKIHTREKPHSCSICGIGFRQRAALHRHQTIHTGFKPYTCKICSQKFRMYNQLTIHLMSHTGQKPFSCSVCSQAFTTKTVLAKHQRIHTGERPYVCDVCGKAFNQSSTLKTHSKVHKTNTSKKKKKTKHQKVESKELCVFKNEDEASGNNEQHVVEDMLEISEKQSDSVEAKFTDILPAPIPQLQNMCERK